MIEKENDREIYTHIHAPRVQAIMEEVRLKVKVHQHKHLIVNHAE